MDLLWLDYHPPCVWNHFRLSHGHHHQCSSLGTDLLKRPERKLDWGKVTRLTIPLNSTDASFNDSSDFSQVIPVK